MAVLEEKPAKRQKYGGRVKGSRNRIKNWELVKTCQAEAPLAIRRLKEIANDRDDLRAACQASTVILAYGYGKPRERFEVTGTLRLEQEMAQAAAMIKQQLLAIVSGASHDDGVRPAVRIGVTVM